MTFGAAILSLGEILGKIATLVTLSLVAQRLGPAQFGVFNFGLGLGVLLAAGVTLGFDQRLVQLVGGDPGSLSARLSSLLALRSALSVLVLTVTLIVVEVLGGDPTRRVVVLVMVTCACVDATVEAFRTAANIRGVQVVPAAVLVLQRLTALVLVIVALNHGSGIVAVAAAYASASVFGLVLMALASRRMANICPRPRRVTSGHVRDFVCVVGITGANEVVSMALFRVDVVILALLAGDIAVGHYSAAYRLLETVLFVSWSVCRVVQPVLADTSGQGPTRRDVLGAASALLCAVYLPYSALLITRGGDVTALLFGPEFRTPELMYGLAFAPILFALAQLATTALLAVRPDPFVLVASLAAFGVNVVGNVAFVPAFGATAAAVMTSLSYGVQALACMHRAREVGFHVRGVGVLIAVVASLVAAAVMTWAGPLWLALLAGGVVYLSLWLVLTRRWDAEGMVFVRSVVKPL